MMTTWLYAILSVLGVSLISLAGIFTLSIATEKLKSILFLLVSFAAGALFGDALLHLLPEAVEKNGFTTSVSLWVIAGIALMFLVEKVVHWHHCHDPEENVKHVHPTAIMNLVGDAVHNFIDGLVIGATYIVSIPVGIATTLAVAFHEIPQEISDFGVLMNGGFTRRRALLFNFLSALTAIVGVTVALLLGSSGTTEALAKSLVPLTAGVFLYIAGADLIPELHKEVAVRKSIGQFVAFLFGISMMLLLLFLE